MLKVLIFFLYQTTEKAIIRKEKHLEEEGDAGDDEIIYKIEVPANRYPSIITFSYSIIFVMSIWEAFNCLDYVQV